MTNTIQRAATAEAAQAVQLPPAHRVWLDGVMTRGVTAADLQIANELLAQVNREVAALQGAVTDLMKKQAWGDPSITTVQRQLVANRETIGEKQTTSHRLAKLRDAINDELKAAK